MTLRPIGIAQTRMQGGSMKMLIIVYKEQFNEDIHELLEKNSVKAYSQIPTIFGKGDAGWIEDSRWQQGANSCIFAALADEQIERLNIAFHQFDQKHKQSHGEALHAFALPCERLL